MSKGTDSRTRWVDWAQNAAIVLLLLSAVMLFVNLPLFGELSDESLLELAQAQSRREVQPARATGGTQISLPLRIVYTNGFARFGADAITTLSGDFERAGTYLSEAVGSAGTAEAVNVSAFLDAMRGEGLYFDFAAAVPADVLSAILGVTTPHTAPPDVKRILLSAGGESVTLYTQDSAGRIYRCATAVSRELLSNFLTSQSGAAVDFAFLLDAPYTRLSPYTLIMNEPVQRAALDSADALSGSEDVLLRRAGFNVRAENRFTEASGTVIVREVSSTLYLNPDGTVEYQGAEASPDSPYYIPAAEAGMPTAAEAAQAAQTLASTLLEDISGSGVPYLSAMHPGSGGYEISFDMMAGGTPIYLADGSHAMTVTTTGQSITGFSLLARRYTFTDEAPPLLPAALSAAIARGWGGVELVTAYVDTLGERTAPEWVAQ